MISYAGIPLTVAKPDQAAWIEASISPRDVYEFERAAFHGLRRGTWALPGFLPERRIKVNSLFWPRGASRWAVGHFLITEADAATLVSRSNVVQPLVLTDGTNSHTVGMWALPTRPLSSFSNLAGWHLLTLVDDRFFWWEKAADIAVDVGTTWAQLYAAIGSALGVTLTYDAINAAYIFPGRALSSRYEYLPMLLDAVAYNVGQRVIRRYDGTVHAQGPTAAATSQAQQLLVAWPKLAGGLISAAMVKAELPPKVGLSFPKWIMDDDECIGQFSGTDVHWEEAAIPGTHPGTTKFFRDTAVAVVADGGEVLNEAELEALTERFALDWYAWQLGVMDVAFVGIRAWAPEGLSDGIEWAYYPGAVATRVQRPAWNDLTDSLNHSADVTALSSISTSGCIVEPPAGDVYIFIDNLFINNLFVTQIDIDVVNIFNEINFYETTINNFTEINIFNEYILCDAWSDQRHTVAEIHCINGFLWALKYVTEYGINKAGCYYEHIIFAEWQFKGCCDCPDDSDSTSGSTSGDDCVSCCGVDEAPRSWWIVIQDTAGVSDIICANCGNYNGVHLATVFNDPITPSLCPWETEELDLCGGTDRLIVWCDEETGYLYVSDGNEGPVTDVDYWRIPLADVDWSGGPNVLELFNEGELSCAFPSTITLYAAEPCENADPPPPPPPPPECCTPAPPDTLYFNLALGGDPGSIWSCFAQPENENIALVRDGSGYTWTSAEGAVTGCCDDEEVGITIALFCKGDKWHLRFSKINLLISNLEVDSCDPFTLTGTMPASLPASNCNAGGTGDGFFSVTEDAL